MLRQLLYLLWSGSLNPVFALRELMPDMPDPSRKFTRDSPTRDDIEHLQFSESTFWLDSRRAYSQNEFERLAEAAKKLTEVLAEMHNTKSPSTTRDLQQKTLTWPIKKRQGSEERALQATFIYDCPRSGEKRTVFQFRAEYDGESRKIGLRNMHNVRTFIGVNQAGWNPIYYNGWMRGQFCHPYRNHVSCTYKFAGFVEGEVYPLSMTLRFTYQMGWAALEPTVTEECHVVHFGENTGEVCPLSDHPSICTIIDVVVTSIPPRP